MVAAYRTLVLARNALLGSIPLKMRQARRRLPGPNGKVLGHGLAEKICWLIWCSETVLECLNHFVVKIELQSVNSSQNRSLDVGVDEVFCSLELFTEDIELKVTAHKPN